MKKIALFLVLFLLALLGAAYAFRVQLLPQFFKPRAAKVFPAKTESSDTANTLSSLIIHESTAEVVAENLQIPWELVFLPDNSLLVTERPGRVLRIKGGSRTPIPVAGVQHVGEGGLLGMALHPQYAENNFIYLYATTRSGEGLTNRVERYRFDEEKNELTDRTVIIENIPGANNHDGGRIAFGPDKYLYITTGDAQQEKLAQDTSSLAGKILRLTDDGQVPADNPFGNAVYSYGHRNSQGIAWDIQGRLWSTEHGPSGLQTGHDELNLIEKGANYGWPSIRGDQHSEGMHLPVIHSGDDDTWAPAGMTIFDNTVLFTGLRGEALYYADIEGDAVKSLRPVLRSYGRLRAVTVGPDSWLYLTTSNTDGRGSPQENDDKIIKVLVSKDE